MVAKKMCYALHGDEEYGNYQKHWEHERDVRTQII